LLAQRADSKEDSAHPTATAASTHTHSRSLSDPDADLRSSDHSSVVRRIPLTSLSFFPPPSSNSSALAGPCPALTPSPSHIPPPAATSSTISKGSTLMSTLRATTLSSLFSVLPINASTCDEIFSCLSVDSVSNSMASDEAAVHKLTAIPTTPKRKPLCTDDAVPVSMPSTTLTNSWRKNRTRHAWLSESRNSEEPYTRDDVEQIALASSPIHTMQMQPAAVMQLPGSMMRSSGPKEAPLADSLNSAWRPPSDHHPQTWWSLQTALFVYSAHNTFTVHPSSHLPSLPRCNALRMRAVTFYFAFPALQRPKLKPCR
jgi:hypothetical protein